MIPKFPNIKCFEKTAPILTATDTAPVCDATISLGHTLALTVIAEGVETLLQSDGLTRMAATPLRDSTTVEPDPPTG